MSTTPAIDFNELRRRVEALGFRAVRQKGSHIRYQHPDGRKTTIPDHGSKDVPKGLLIKIIRHDIKMIVDEFFESTN
jgi:predicted RNA binding protein YcfA (HicA-like mRNA interferase family)